MDLQPTYRADIIHLLPIVTKYHGHPSTESRHIATGGLFSNVFFQTSGKFKSSGPEVLESLFNGNFAEQPELQHFCRGCCTSKSVTMAKMKSYALKILAGSIPKVFARHKWVAIHHVCLWLIFEFQQET